MILSCPQCAARFRVSESAFPAGGGRKVECSRCHWRWRAAGPQVGAAPLRAADPALEGAAGVGAVSAAASRGNTGFEDPPPSHSGAPYFWAIVVLCAAAVAGALIIGFQEEIITLFSTR